jgi:hypothetical protein
MKSKLKKNPRIFNPVNDLYLKDFGQISLNVDEQFSISDGDILNDIVKKEWGLYLTNSVNDTLKKQGVKTAIIMSTLTEKKKVFIQLVKKDKIAEYENYLKKNKAIVVMWVDEMFP